MKKIIPQLLFCLFPVITFAQWSQMGNQLSGAPSDKLGFTHAIELDSAGNTLAVGSAYNSDLSPFSGYAKVYDWNGTQWVMRGNAIVGDSVNAGLGAAVGLSADGLTLAIGIFSGINSLGYQSGLVRVYDWSGTSWNLRGSVIEGEGNPNPLYDKDAFGSALQLSSDGNYIVIGGRGNTPQLGVNQLSGHARIYHWNGTAWEQKGQDLDGNNGIEEFGYAVSINDAGSRVAIGGRYHSTILQDAGYVRIFDWNGSAWTQIGDTLFGTTLGGKFGTAVQMSPDGNTVAVGAPREAANDGVTKVFDWNGSNWIQRGADIVGLSGGQSGTSIDLSMDAKIIAVGEPWANIANGRARVYRWTGSTWAQIDNTIAPSGSTTSINAFGSAVRMNAIGSRIAVGEPSKDVGGISAGRVTVYENTTVLSTPEISHSNLKLFPNPSSGSISISANEAIESVTLYSITGQELMYLHGWATLFELDLSRQPTGNYLAKIQTQNGVEVISFKKN